MNFINFSCLIFRIICPNTADQNVFQVVKYANTPNLYTNYSFNLLIDCLASI